MSAQRAESQGGESVPTALHGETLIATSSSGLQQEMPGVNTSRSVDLECKVCSVSFLSKSALNRHRQTHPVELKLNHACSECGWRFRRLNVLKDHSMNVHKVKEGSLGKDKAEMLAGCSAERYPGPPHDTSSASKQDKGVGSSSHHCQQCGKSACECNSSTDQHACKQCGKVFLLYEFLVKHIHNVHLTSTSHSKNQRRFECQQCGVSFARAWCLSRHTRTIHMGERRYACEQCGKRLHRSEHLSVHIKTVHEGERRHACQQCDKRFTEAGLSNQSRTVHMGERRHGCQHCDKRFGNASNLQCHIRTVHMGEREYQCKECGAILTTAHSLSRHTRSVHCGERQYECELCNARFTRASHLSVHVKTVHKGERRHACEHCDKRFGQAIDLQRHIRAKHAL